MSWKGCSKKYANVVPLGDALRLFRSMLHSLHVSRRGMLLLRLYVQSRMHIVHSGLRRTMKDNGTTLQRQACAGLSKLSRISLPRTRVIRVG